MTDPYRSAATPSADPAPARRLVSVHRVSQRLAWVVGALFVLGVGPIGSWFGGPLVEVIAIGAALVFIVLTMLVAPRSIALFEDGVEVRRWIGAPRAIAFDDVVSVYFDIGVRNTDFHGTVATDATWILEDHTGRRVRIPHNVSDDERLFRTIERECVTPVVSSAFAALAEGETLTFGPLSVWRKGLSIKGQYFGWDRIARVEASPRRIFVHARGELTSRSVALASVPFPVLFLSLVERAGPRPEYIEGFTRS